MTEERRRSPRARLGAARVHYQTPTGTPLSGRAVDLGSGGLFVQSATLLPVGKHVTLEIHVPGELAPWSAVGRVVWIRKQADGAGKPAGMGIAFIDIDDAVRSSIGRLLARAPEGSASKRPADGAPSRERTVQGIGRSMETPVVPAPVLLAVPSRERTVLGIAPATQPSMRSEPPLRVQETQASELESASDLPDWPDEPPEPTHQATPLEPPEPVKAQRPVAEPSVPFDLVAKPTPASRPPPPEPVREPSLSPAGVPKRGRGRPLLLALLVAFAGGGYAMHARLRPWIAPYYAAFKSPIPAAAPSAVPATGDPPPASVAASAAASATGSARATDIATPPAAATGVPRVAGDAGTDASRAAPSAAPASAVAVPPASAHHPPAPAQAPRPAPSAKATGDNPYE